MIDTTPLVALVSRPLKRPMNSLAQRIHASFPRGIDLSRLKREAVLAYQRREQAFFAGNEGIAHILDEAAQSSYQAYVEACDAAGRILN